MLEFINNIMQKFGLGGIIGDSAMTKMVKEGFEKVSDGIGKIDPELGQKMKDLGGKLSEGNTADFVNSLKEIKDSLNQDSKYSAIYNELAGFLAAAHELIGARHANRGEAFGKFAKEGKELGQAILKSIGSSSTASNNTTPTSTNATDTNTENKN